MKDNLHFSVSRVIFLIRGEGSKLIRFFFNLTDHDLRMFLYFVPSEQKFGIISENKTSENWSYQKMSKVKVVHLNLFL